MKHRIALIWFVLLFSSMSLSAQSPAAVPVPSQIANAKTVFVGYAGSRWYTQADGILVYQSVRAGLASLGYTLVQSPAEAELAIEASVPNDTLVDTRLDIAVYDVKTHVLLWAFDEPLNGRLDKTVPKNIDKSVALFTADLRVLSSGPIPSPVAPDKKIRMSQEPK